MTPQQDPVESETGTSIRIRGPRLLLRALSPAEIEEEWRAMVDADPMTIAVVPDEAGFKSRLQRSGRLDEGWLDLAIDLDGESVGRIQTFVPRGDRYLRTCSRSGSVFARTPEGSVTAEKPLLCSPIGSSSMRELSGSRRPPTPPTRRCEPSSSAWMGARRSSERVRSRLGHARHHPPRLERSAHLLNCLRVRLAVAALGGSKL
jgi:hypothetical protein